MAITIQDLDNAELDTDHLAAIATSTALTATDRLGHTKRTLAGLSAEFPNAQANAAQAASSASAAGQSAGIAGASRVAAAASAAAAATSEQVALVAGHGYATKAAALADTALTVGMSFAYVLPDGPYAGAFQAAIKNSGASSTDIGYPFATISGVAALYHSDYYDIGDFTKILSANDVFSIGPFRRSLPDGSYAAYTGTLTDNLLTPGQNDYIVMDFSSPSITLTKGTRGHAWEEAPYLGLTKAVLAFKEVGVWRSHIVGVQRLLDQYNDRLVHRVYTLGGITTAQAGTTFRINQIRYGRKDGGYLIYEEGETFSTPGDNAYIIADVSGWIIVLSLGTRSHRWEEEPHLGPDRFVLAWKEVGQWASDFPVIHELIRSPQRQAEGYFDIGDTTMITRADTAFTTTDFRYSRADGTFVAYTGGTPIPTPGANDYLVMDYGGSAITLTKGTRGHAWEEAPYLSRYQCIYAFKEVDAWRSPLPLVQRLLDRFYAGQNPIVYIEKTIKQGGTVGVDCDYTSIPEALDALSDGTFYRRYMVRVMDGTYDYSSLGRLYLGFRPYVTLRARALGAVKVVMRHPTFDSRHAGFDPDYYGQVIPFAAIENLIIVCANGKAPVHIDSAAWGKGVIQAVNCVLINEDPAGAPHATIDCAVGLHQGQTVELINCRGPGCMYAHTAHLDYVGPGTKFRVVNCDMDYTMIGDLQTYGIDAYEFVGSRIRLVRYQISDQFGVRGYLEPAIRLNFVDCDIERVRGELLAAGYAENEIWDVVFNGKFPLFITSMHSSHFCPSDVLVRGDRVALSKTVPGAIKKWAAGDQLYGVTEDNFGGVVSGVPTPDPTYFGTVQRHGTVNMPANATSAPIVYDDPLELMSTGQVRRLTAGGQLIGWARTGLASGEFGVLVKLAR